MSAKSILHRYLIRRMAELPVDPSELREHLASVAARDRLKVTEEELNSLTPTLSKGEGKNGDFEIAAPVAKTAPKSRRKSKKGDNTTETV